MRVIVIGGGEVGQHVTAWLSGEGHNVTVVDEDESRVDSLQSQLDALVVAGNGASPKFLQTIDAGRADLLLAVTQSDEVNSFAALAAHHLGAKRTVARVRDPDYFGTAGAVAYDVLGIDFVIHPERATADDLAEAILLPGAVRVEYFGEGMVAVAEIILTEHSPLLGIPLGERRMVNPHYIVGVVRDGQAEIVRKEEELRAGAHILVAAARADIGVVAAQLAGHARKVREVVIFGGGRVGLPLAMRLEAAGEFRVTIMERDGTRARYVAEKLAGTTVVHEEGISKDVMLAHGVDHAGAFIACAGDDRANLLAAMRAKQLGADLCLSVVSREEFVPLVDALGVDAGYSPRLATAEAILRFVRGENVHAMHLLFSGSEVVELQADPGARVVGRHLSEIELPPGCEVAAIVRGGRVVIPRRQELIQADDHVLVFGVSGATAQVHAAFDA